LSEDVFEAKQIKIIGHVRKEGVIKVKMGKTVASKLLHVSGRMKLCYWFLHIADFEITSITIHRHVSR